MKPVSHNIIIIVTVIIVIIMLHAVRSAIAATAELPVYFNSVFEKTCASTQKDVKRHVFLDFEKKTFKKRTYSFRSH